MNAVLALAVLALLAVATWLPFRLERGGDDGISRLEDGRELARSA